MMGGNTFNDKVFQRQKTHIRELSEKLDIVRDEMWAILDILNEMSRPAGIRLNPIRNKILDIINLLNKQQPSK